MLRVTLTLASGVQVVYDADDAEAAEHVEMVRHVWGGGDTFRDLVVGSADGITDWVRLADISAVRVAPAHSPDQEGSGDASSG